MSEREFSIPMGPHNFATKFKKFLAKKRDRKENPVQVYRTMPINPRDVLDQPSRRERT